MPESFSQRHGLVDPPTGILLREEAPPSLRMFLLNLPHDEYFDNFAMRKVICGVLQVWPDPGVQPYYDCQKHLKACEWFRVYDIVEAIYTYLEENDAPFTAGLDCFLEAINKAFIAQNIGWQLTRGGKIIMRGDEAFEANVNSALTMLNKTEKPTAAGHLRFAIAALSARPKANTSGAVGHATNAVECVLGEITREAGTLGDYLKRHPELFPSSLKKAVEGLWGYACNEGGRHGKEGTEPAPAEAEFTVAVCAATCTLLTRQSPNGK